MNIWKVSHRPLHWAAGLGAAVLLSACGGGGLPQLSAAKAANDTHQYSAMLDWGLRLVVLLAERIARLKIGPGTQPGVEMGPLVTAEHLAKVASYVESAKARGVAVQIFGLSDDNARAFWNWKFIGDVPDMPQTRAMLMRACDLRLPARLKKPDLDFIADALLSAVGVIKQAQTDAA